MALTFRARASQIYPAPRALVWALISDTNRSDRAIGASMARYRWERDEDGRMIRIAAGSELGVPLEWVEPPYRWMEGSFISGMRKFRKGPAEKGELSVTLSDAPDGGTELKAEATFVAGGILAWLLGWIRRLMLQHALARYLVRLGEVLRTAKLDDDPTGAEPPVVRARRVLAQTSDAITTGPRTEPDAHMLSVREARLLEQPIDRKIADLLIRHLRERPDEEVSQMRPFELARMWGVDRREVLRTFLYSTVAGLTDLRWQVNCPVCRVGASIVSDLSEVGEQSHCEACQIDYDTDFAKHVEAVFPCNAAVRPIHTALYCASSPAFMPHVHSQLHAEPSTTTKYTGDLPMGAVHLRALGVGGGADLDIDRPPANLKIRITADGLTAQESGESKSTSSAIEIVNETPMPAHVLIERAGWSADTVLGNVIASFPEFHGLFATEAPAAGVELRVGNLAVLFSDLVGSTALYERVGDARAFAIVQDHFRAMRKAIEANQGAIVKTMGDAVMASFPSLREAVAGGLAMIAAHDAEHDGDDLGVKIGVHAGPCLAVRANERLDFFGTTVNMAARLQAKADSSEIVLTAECAADPTVAPLLAKLPARRFEAALKGIASEQRLVGCSCARKVAEAGAA